MVTRIQCVVSIVVGFRASVESRLLFRSENTWLSELLGGPVLRQCNLNILNVAWPWQCSIAPLFSLSMPIRSLWGEQEKEVVGVGAERYVCHRVRVLGCSGGRVGHAWWSHVHWGWVRVGFDTTGWGGHGGVVCSYIRSHFPFQGVFALLCACNFSFCSSSALASVARDVLSLRGHSCALRSVCAIWTGLFASPYPVASL